MEVGLDLHTVRVRAPRTTKNLPLDDFDGSKSSALTSLKDALSPLVKGNYKGILGKTITIKDLQSDDKGFDGLAFIGTYGLSSDVIDINDGKRAFAKGKHHAETAPYYFKLYVPKGGTVALLATQRLGQSGVGTHLKTIFSDYFQKKFPNYRLNIGGVTPDYVVKRLISSGVPKSVKFIKNSIPSDFADVVYGKSKEMEGSVEVIVKSKEASLFRKSKIQAAMQSVDGIASLYSFGAFEPDDVRMQVSVNGKIRTVSLANKGNMRTTFDITSEVNLAASGYPDRASVATEALDLMKEVAKPLGVKL